MSLAAAHAAAFYREVAASGRVWTIRDSGGFPAPRGDGPRAMPFWSSRDRAELIIKAVPTYASFTPVELQLGEFLERWLPGLDRDKLRVGLNWSGDRATGYDVDPSFVAAAIENCRISTSNQRLERP
jgi:hypothetical protein